MSTTINNTNVHLSAPMSSSDFIDFLNDDSESSSLSSRRAAINATPARLTTPKVLMLCNGICRSYRTALR